MTSKRHWRPPREKDPPWIGAGRDEDLRRLYTSHPDQVQVQPPCEDRWISRYLTRLEEWDNQFGDGLTSTKAIRDAVQAYGAFCSSCCPNDRRRAWAIIHKACWFLSRQSLRN